MRLNHGYKRKQAEEKSGKALEEKGRFKDRYSRELYYQRTQIEI